ncbi:MAG TPA: Do family serine endopeptidase [Caulobacteraceae bacterium]|nr:Do family serine endopeptidase [Caulobacteraceae bacterium]
MKTLSKTFLFALCLVLSASQGACGRAQPVNLPAPDRRETPADAAEMRLSFAPVVRKAAPAVVNVYSRRMVRTQVDPFWSLFMGGAGIPQERVAQSLGSGSIVRSDGIILTNHHVIEGAQEIVVVTQDRREWPAKVLLDDPRADLAVLKIDPGAEKLPTIAIDASDDVQVGDLVLAIGNPFGVGQTVTNGIVSALARTGGSGAIASYIQTDAAINPGNSGGPLVDMNGDLIGVDTAIVSPAGQSSGVGFAIPAALAKQVVTTALGGAHEVVRPWLGLKGQSLSGDMAKSLGLAAPEGVLAAEVWPNGPSARAGVARGDVILSIDGQAVNDPGDLNYRVATLAPGATVNLVVHKPGGEDRTLAVRLEAPPDQPAKDEQTIQGRNPLNGATVINLSPAAATALGLDPFAGQGVLVTSVQGGYAANLGLQPGDFIRQVNGVQIATVGQLTGLLATPASGWTLVIERNGQTITARVQI